MAETKKEEDKGGGGGGGGGPPLTEEVLAAECLGGYLGGLDLRESWGLSWRV